MTFASPPILVPHGRTAVQPPETVAPADWSLDHIGFHDVLSALNPLQYLPVVGMIYREVTGDTVHPALRIAVSAATSVLLGPAGIGLTMLCAAADEVRTNRGTAPAGGWVEAAAAYHRASRVA